MKTYKKTNCQFIENRIICNDDIIAIPEDVYYMLENLEENLQKARFIMKQPQAVKAPSMRGFHRKHASTLPQLQKPATPFNDEQLMKSMAIMQEIDSVETVNNVNQTIMNMKVLFDWVASDYVIDDPDGTVDAFDLVEIGNPLELKSQDLVAFIMEIESADRWASGINEGDAIVTAEPEAEAEEEEAKEE